MTDSLEVREWQEDPFSHSQMAVHNSSFYLLSLKRFLVYELFVGKGSPKSHTVSKCVFISPSNLISGAVYLLLVILHLPHKDINFLHTFQIVVSIINIFYRPVVQRMLLYKEGKKSKWCTWTTEASIIVQAGCIPYIPSNFSLSHDAYSAPAQLSHLLGSHHALLTVVCTACHWFLICEWAQHKYINTNCNSSCSKDDTDLFCLPYFSYLCPSFLSVMIALYSKMELLKCGNTRAVRWPDRL